MKPELELVMKMQYPDYKKIDDLKIDNLEYCNLEYCDSIIGKIIITKMRKIFTNLLRIDFYSDENGLPCEHETILHLTLINGEEILYKFCLSVLHGINPEEITRS